MEKDTPPFDTQLLLVLTNKSWSSCINEDKANFRARKSIRDKGALQHFKEIVSLKRRNS